MSTYVKYDRKKGLYNTSQKVQINNDYYLDFGNSAINLANLYKDGERIDFGGNEAVSVKNLITVSPQGGNYTTIAQAFAQSYTEDTIIILGPGEYSVDETLVIDADSKIKAIVGYDRNLCKIIAGDSLAGPILHIDSPSFTILTKDITLQGDSTWMLTSGNYGVRMTGAGILAMFDCAINNCNSWAVCEGISSGLQAFTADGGFYQNAKLGGFIGSNTSGNSTLFLKGPSIRSSTECKLIHGKNNCQIRFRNSFVGIPSSETNVGVGLYLEDTSDAQVQTLQMDKLTTAIHIQDTARLEILVDKISDTCTTHLNQEDTSTIEMSGCDMAGDRIFIEDHANVNLNFYDTKSGDQGLRLFSELSIGSPEKGYEAVFGRGDSYTRGQYMYCSTWIPNIAPPGIVPPMSDIYDLYQEDDPYRISFEVNDDTISEFTTLALIRTSGSDPVFDDALYITSTLKDSSSGDYLKFPGFKYILANDFDQTDRLIIELWNGDDWFAVPYMVTEANADYLPKGDSIFEGTAKSYQVRFCQRAVSEVWEKTTPDQTPPDSDNGEDKYWARIRVDTTLNPDESVPVITQIKLHTDRTEINPDGFMEMFGVARPIKSVAWDVNIAQPGSSSPGNKDIFLSDNLDVGRSENIFSNNAIDRTGFACYLPPEIDTACGMSLRWSWINSDNGSGNIRWVIRWGYSDDEDSVYSSTSSAPDSGSNEQSKVIITVTNEAEDQQQSDKYRMDIRELIANDENLKSQIFWVTLERTGNHDDDTYSGDVYLIQAQARHRAWCLGAYAEGEF